MKNFDIRNGEETGRFRVYSQRTGKTYIVEPLGQTRTGWGDVDPATKQVQGAYGEKYKGSIEKTESIITPENGFINIKDTAVGVNPLDHVQMLDSKYPSI